jgi:hypothetical protein
MVVARPTSNLRMMLSELTDPRAEPSCGGDSSLLWAWARERCNSDAYCSERGVQALRE